MRWGRAKVQRDVIAAIATAPGEGAIGIVRLSGAGSHEVVRRVWRGRWPAPGEFRRGYVVGARDGEVLDEALLLVFRGPRSYTGEDGAELQCHGGTVVLRRCLGAVLDAGARLARPGEFSERAFLNGRLDLSQAEAVIDIIRARTEAGVRQAMAQLQGWLRDAVRTMRSECLGLLTGIEAAIDFPDEVDEPEREWLARGAEACAACAEELAGTYARGRLLREGMRVAIVGRPNVGKSSLLNALAGEERAIVAPVPGTTRDAIREWIEIGGVAVELVDTAGLREDGDELERLGMARTREWMERADVILAVLDGHSSPGAEDREILSWIDAGRMLIVLNKADLGVAAAAVRVAEEFSAGFGMVEASAVMPGGTERLAEKLAEIARAGYGMESGAVATRERHRRALTEAAAALRDCASGARGGVPLDLLAIDLRRALASLGEITGETVRDDVVERIFAEFCVGK